MTASTYRHLTNAEVAAGLALFYGVAEHVCFDAAEAVRQINAAVAALTAARALLAADVTP